MLNGRSLSVDVIRFAWRGILVLYTRSITDLNRFPERLHVKEKIGGAGSYRLRRRRCTDQPSVIISSRYRNARRREQLLYSTLVVGLCRYIPITSESPVSVMIIRRHERDLHEFRKLVPQRSIFRELLGERHVVRDREIAHTERSHLLETLAELAHPAVILPVLVVP